MRKQQKIHLIRVIRVPLYFSRSARNEAAATPTLINPIVLFNLDKKIRENPYNPCHPCAIVFHTDEKYYIRLTQKL